MGVFYIIRIALSEVLNGYTIPIDVLRFITIVFIKLSSYWQLQMQSIYSEFHFETCNKPKCLIQEVLCLKISWYTFQKTISHTIIVGTI